MIFTPTPHTMFAAPYGACAYGVDEFQNSDCNVASTPGGSTGTTTTTTTQRGSSLTDTGFGIALVVALASLLVLIAVVVRFAKRGKVSPVTVTPESAEVAKPAPKKIQL